MEVDEVFKLLFTNNRKKLCSNFHKRTVSQKFLTHRTVINLRSKRLSAVPEQRTRNESQRPREK